jgi:branched-chain amino acid aminotransferase
LARNDLGIPVLEREVDRTELYIADEVLLCGTAVEVVPVLGVDRLPVGDGEPGRITTELTDLYFRAARGALERYSHWLTEVS